MPHTIEMIRFPVPFDPATAQTMPCYSARSRREVQTFDSINTRLVEHWQTDSPQLQYRERDVSGLLFAMDMNPTASRLYREDLRQSQPYVVPSPNTVTQKVTIQIEQDMSRLLGRIDKINQELDKNRQARIQARQPPDTLSAADQELVKTRKELQEHYALLNKRQKQVQIDAMADNPYFDKYDVASDSRNIVREMRSVVTEDVVDRGVRESQKLLTRELENRWLPARYAENAGIDQLSAYELMRPRTNDMSRRYN